PGRAGLLLPHARPGAVHRAGGDHRIVHGQLRDRQGRSDGRRRPARRDAPGRARRLPDLRGGLHPGVEGRVRELAVAGGARAADHPGVDDRRRRLEHLGLAAAGRGDRSVAGEREGAGRSTAEVHGTDCGQQARRVRGPGLGSLHQQGPEPPQRPVAPSRFWEWIRHHMTAILSTVADYSVMITLVEVVHLGPVAATPMAAFAGGVTNFNVNRRFTYRAQNAPLKGQLWRYALVSGCSLALNTLGEFLFLKVPHMHY